MLYSQLFLFLLAIFAFTASPKVETPLAPLPALALFAGLLAAWAVFCRRRFAETRSTTAWFRQEKRLTILALLLFCALVYGCDLRYYLSFLSLGEHTPSLVNILGLAVFFLCLLPVWDAARPSYQRIFAARYTRMGFWWLRCRTHLPIVLPWIFFSLATDAVGLLPLPRLQAALASSWGDFFLFFIFILAITILLPPLTRRLWGCVPLPAGPLRDSLTEFCTRQGFHDGLYLWPLFEGRTMTAAVMGLVPGLRFILLTPAIIERSSQDELLAVLAHELGHVHKRHLLWYVLLLLGFSALMGALADPVLHLLLPPPRLESLLVSTGIAPDTLIATGQSLPLLAALLLFFRFVFGWFLRNFERQADLRVIKVMGNGLGLVSTFEQLSGVSGGKDKPSWHHFGLGERIRAIEAAETDPEYSVRHDKKVGRVLTGYFLTVIFLTIIFSTFHGDVRQMDKQYKTAIGTGLLQRQIKLHPEDARFPLALANFQAQRGLEREALANYEIALKTFPGAAVILNDFAWFLVTCRDLSLRDPERALPMAELAVALKPAGSIHDTLATVYWANGLSDMAVNEQRRAITADPQNRRYYLRRLVALRAMSYQDSLEKSQGQLVPAQETP